MARGGRPDSGAEHGRTTGSAPTPPSRPPVATAEVPPRWASIIRHIGRAASGSVAALGFFVFLGWIFDWSVLKSLHPSLVTMKANSSVLFILLGGGIWCASSDGAASRARRILGLAVATVGGITLVQDLFAMNFGIDELLFRDPASTLYPGRMSPATALDFLLLGLALWLADTGLRFRASQVTVLLAALISLLAFCGYLYGVKSLYAVGPYGTMALHTCLGFLVACCALLCSRPTEGVVGVLMSNTSAGHFVRRIQPAIILVPIVLGWLRLRGELAGYYDMPFGLALSVLSTVILLTLLTWGIVPTLLRAELARKALLEEVTEREQDLSITLNSIRDSVIATDVDGRVTWMNPVAEQLTGWTAAEARTRPLDEIFQIRNEETREAIESPAKRVLREGVVVGLADKTVLISRDGAEYPIADSGAPIRDSSGAVRGVVLVFRNIGAERAAQRALRESEERLRIAQQVARVGTFEWNVQTGVNTWTPGLEAMYGLPPGGFAGTQPAWESLVHPEDRASAVRLVEQAFETGAATEAEFRVVWPDGSVHWLTGRWQVFGDESGKPLRLTGIHIDITERKQAEVERERLLGEIRELSRNLELRVAERTRELEQAKERLNGIISTAADGIVSTDEQQRITIFNKGAEEIFGWTQDEVLGRPLDTLLPQRLRGAHRQHLATFEMEPTKARRIAERRAVLGLRKNGEEFPGEAAISKLKQDAGSIFTVIIRDISERVRIEDERQVFVSLIEHSSDFIGIADPSGKPIYVNPAGRRMVGLPAAYPVEKTQIPEYYPPEQRAFALDVILKSMIERGRWSGETFFRHWQTEEAIPVSDEHFMIRDPSGKRILGMGTVTRDISEARRAAAERDHWYARAMALFDQAADSIFIADLEGRFTDVNATACKMLGYARQELVGKTNSDIIPAADVPRLARAREYLLAPGTVQVAEWTHLKKDGTPIPVEVSSKILPDGRWLAFVRDIRERKRLEDELRASENKFRTLAEAMPQIVWITRPDGWNIYFNQQWVNYTGLTLEESYGHGWNTPFHPDDRQRSWDAWQHAVQTDGVYNLECRLRRADGTYRWWLIRGVSLHDESGKVINWFGTCTDVDDIKRTEEALTRARDEAEAASEKLRVSEERFRLTIDEAPIGMALVALDGRFVRVNHALCEIVGYSPAELLKLTFHDITHPADLEIDVALADQLARGEIPRYQLEKRYLRKDGTSVDVLLSGSILRDKEGAPLYYIAQIADITERKHAEAALKGSEERLNLALDSAQMGIWDLDLVSDTAVRSLRHAQIFGYASLPPRWGRAIFLDHVAPEDREDARQKFAEALASGRINLECRILWPDKSVHWVSAKGRVVARDPGGAPLRMLGTVVDITEQKKMEEERARTLTERETLLKEVHHRVKNNLQVLSSLFYLQRQRTAEEPLRTLLDESRNRIQSIALIHEKLYQSERLAWIDFGDYLKDLTCRLTRAIGAQSPQARISIQADNVFLDIERAIPCALIVNELVSNALKHAFPGGRSGEVRVTARLVAPDLLELAVSDTGIGFPADLDFKNTNTLGMKLVCSLTTQLRGTVKLSRDGGTRFEIRFSVPPGKMRV